MKTTFEKKVFFAHNKQTDSDSNTFCLEKKGKMNAITLVGVSIIFLYSLVQIMRFYGVGEEVYGVYLLFYVFLMVSMLILPKDYPKT